MSNVKIICMFRVRLEQNHLYFKLIPGLYNVTSTRFNPKKSLKEVVIKDPRKRLPGHSRSPDINKLVRTLSPKTKDLL
jgi:hypothetical protein